ncbi:MAG: HAD-IC family P-type ATPase [Clostridia bacterium]|nr:HAD-IC family P-type ATPase [Clostridia bacterium]
MAVRRSKREHEASLLSYSYGRIILKNIFTVFNLICFLIAVPLLLVGSYKNLLYLGTVFCNIVIGIFQECRAKRTIEKLSLQIEPKVDVEIDGEFVELAADKVQCNDRCRFQSGKQVAVDCRIISGAVEVNESLLTGESVPVIKERGELLMAGSIIISGRCYATAECVGRDCYLRRIEQAVKQYKAPVSRLMRDLRRISIATGVSILPIGVLLMITEYKAFGMFDAVVHASAAMLSVMPIGLMLLASVSLAVGVIRLSKRGALARDLYCIEALARVNVLCVDKTGTLTNGNLSIRAASSICGETLTELTEADKEMLCNFVLAMPKDNVTAKALAEHFNCEATSEPLSIIPFSSARKCTQMEFSNGTYTLGAPDWVLPSCPEWLRSIIDDIALSGCRVLMFAKDESPLALIALTDTIRDSVPDTLGYFQNEGVKICLISGDHEKTVQAIAKSLGLYGKVCDCTALNTASDFENAVKGDLLFARVTPDKKASLVAALQNSGLYVAMVGDGVNDLPALKQADCAIAMASGADAPKQVSQLVLMDDNFDTLPQILLEGRRIVNNIKRSSQLFLKKSIFSLCIAIIMLIFTTPYPFENIQWTLIGMFTVGIPAFFLALEPNNLRFSGHFIRDVVSEALPGALVNLLFVLLAQYALPPLGFTELQTQTVVIYLTALVGLAVLLRCCLPLNRLRSALLITMSTLMIGSLLLLKTLLGIQIPDLRCLIVIVPLAAAAPFLLLLLSKVISRVKKPLDSQLSL